jgi:hypothetical protein
MPYVMHDDESKALQGAVSTSMQLAVEPAPIGLHELTI